MDEATILTLEGLPGPVSPGANLLENGAGATFKTWAPTARRVRVRWDYTQDESGAWHHQQEAGLQRLEGGMWAGFVPGLKDGERYMFHVTGPEGGGEDTKRDPYARDLTDNPAWPECQCLLCDPNQFSWHNDNRVLAFHCWVPGEGHDVVIAASLSDTTHYDYQLGFPLAGHWQEVFNSDAYDHWVNPRVAGNSGGINATAAGMHGLPASTQIVIPANSIVVFEH